MHLYIYKFRERAAFILARNFCVSWISIQRAFCQQVINKDFHWLDTTKFPLVNIMLQSHLGHHFVTWIQGHSYNETTDTWTSFMTKQSWVNNYHREGLLADLFIWALFTLLLSTLITIFEIKTLAFTAVSSACQWMIICLNHLSYIRISQVCHLVVGTQAQSIFIHTKWQYLRRDTFDLSEGMANVYTRITSRAMICESIMIIPCHGCFRL